VVRAALEREAADVSTRTVGSEPDLGLRDEIRRALETLPERQRIAIVLHYYEDLPEDRLAEAMGCSPSAARSLVSRGMETLRGLIGGETP
jgi:RNA polymerase sigma factor (sigma-70 family)